MTPSGYIVVLLRPEAAEPPTDEPTGDAEPIAALKANGWDVRPISDDDGDPDAKRSFIVPAEGLGDPEEAARSIADLDGVETAYFTPAGEAPRSH